MPKVIMQCSFCDTQYMGDNAKTDVIQHEISKHWSEFTRGHRVYAIAKPDLTEGRGYFSNDGQFFVADSPEEVADYYLNKLHGEDHEIVHGQGHRPYWSWVVLEIKQPTAGKFIFCASNTTVDAML